MPIYDYGCAACGAVTEVIHRIDDPIPRFCPACGAEGRLKKEFVAPTVHFKGSGWAKKDRSSTSAPSRARTKEGDGTAPAGTSSSESGTSKAAATSSTADPPKAAASGDGGGD